MDRRTTWLPLTLIALLAGGALVPHLTAPGSPSAPPAADRPASVADAPDATAGNIAFVEQLAQLLNIDISEPALVRSARKLAEGTPARDDIEMIRCFFDLDVERGPDFDAALAAVSKSWPICGDRRIANDELPQATLVLVRTALNGVVSLGPARTLDAGSDRDEPVGRSIKRAAASLRAADKKMSRAVIEAAAAAARRRMAFLEVRRAARRQFSTPDESCGARERVQFVIATVPDPVDSYAQWQFDPTLMALRQAATADGYLPTRFFFPDATAAPAAAKGSDAPLHERFPGVLLFRHDERGAAEVHKLLVLLFAYETATAGVHPAALSAALRIVLDWHLSDSPCGAGEALEPVLMLAPTFSGSSESIAAVLDAMKEPLGMRPTRIISGSANAAGNFLVLNRQSPPVVSFKATVYPNKVLIDTMWQYLSTVVDPRLEGARSVAWLTESNTTYGNSFAAGLPGRQSVDHLVRSFPLHLSRIRSGEPAPGTALPQRFGPLKIDDAMRYTDQLPLMTESTTRSYVELMLAYTLRSLRDARIGFVGLVATDARDKMFLAREVLRETPNVILFTTDSDLLYSHPDVYSSTSGLLMAAPYTLDASRHLVGRSRGEELYEAPESTMVGVYNALIMLLNYNEQGRPTDQKAPGLLRYSPAKCGPREKPFDCYRPDVWISVVGRDGPRPVWRAHPALDYADPTLGPALNQYLQEALPYGNDSVTAAVEPRVAVGSSIRVTLALSMVLIICQAVVAIFRRGTSQETVYEAAPYLLVACLALVPVALVLGAFAWLWLVKPDPNVVNSLATFTAAAAIVLLIMGAYRSARRMQGSAAHHWAPITGALAAASMTGMLVWFLARQRLDPRLFVDRMSQWFDGTSPLIPIATLALAVYAWPAVECFRLWRRPPVGAEEKAYLAGLLGPRGSASLDELACLNASLVSFHARPVRFATFIAAVLLLIGFDLYRWPLTTIDGVPVGAYVTVGLVVVELIVVIVLTQFVCLWLNVSKLLERVAAVGFQAAFQALPDELFPSGAVPRMPHLHELAFSVELWQKLPTMRQRLDPGGDLQQSFEQELAVNPDTPVSRTHVWGKLLVHAAQAAVEAREERRSPRPAGAPANVVPMTSVTGPVSLVFGLAVDETLQREGDRRASESERARREQFAVFPLVLIVRTMLARMWDNIAFVAAALALVALCLWGYPLQMKEALVRLIWTDVMVGVAIVLYVFVRMERNEIISHITSTKPGEIAWDRDFVVKLLLYGLLPLAGLFATQFPNLSGTLVRWLEPVQKALP